MHVPQARETPRGASTGFPLPLREESIGPLTERTLPSLVHTSHDSSHELRNATGAANRAPSSQTEGSDMCHDLGDNFTYSTVENPQQHLSVSSIRSAPEVPRQRLPPPSTDNIIEDERQPTDQLLAGISGDRPLTRPELETKLRQAMVTTSLTAAGDEIAKYLPRGALSELVTESSVAAVLQSEGVPRNESKSLAKEICIPSTVKPDGGRKGQNQQSTRRKLFATLVMISKVEAIGCFIDEGIFDTDLPLSLSARPKERINCCKDWTVSDTEMFGYRQWLFLSPFFADLERVKGEKAKVMHYVLQPGIVPPLKFIKNQVLDSDAEAETEVNGGFSTVSRVKFHPDHHNFGPESKRSNLIHALKKLHSPSRKEFQREVEALKRFSHSGDRHLIKLLWTYEWKGSFYLVFPCAEGNLWDFTKKYANGPTRDRPRKVWVRWLAEQCYGIAAALSRIHGADISDPNENKASGSSANLHPSQTPADAAGRKYGRHGDLKPENILWFSADNTIAGRGQTIGVLQVSDFGLCDFHSRYSKSNIPANRFLLSGTYQAPESLISNSLSQSYDIWTLGCVYIQFISWFLLGHAETKDEFSARRLEDDHNPIREDTFFKVETENGQFQFRAVVKKSVLDWIARLTDHRDCSAFLGEFLRYILSDMLVAESQRRATCPQVAESLHRMLERCKTDSSYYLGRSGSPESPRLSTSTSIFFYSVSDREAVLDSLARKGRSVTFPQPPQSQPPKVWTRARALTAPEAGGFSRPPTPFKERGVAEQPMSADAQQEARPESDRQHDDGSVHSLSVDLPASTVLANGPQGHGQASGSTVNVGPTGAEGSANTERCHPRKVQKKGFGKKLKHLCISCCSCFC